MEYNVKDLVDEILADFKRSGDKNSPDFMRTKLNKKVHVMEFSNAILSRNMPSYAGKEVPADKRLSITHFKKVLKEANPNITLYNNENVVTKLLYLESKGKLLLIGPSFGSIREALTKLIAKLDLPTIDSKRPRYNTIEVGHTADYGKESRNTVLGARIRTAFESTGFDTVKVDQLFSTYDRKLSHKHSKYKVNYSRSSSLASELNAELEFIYTVPQEYAVNSALSKEEGNIASGFTRSTSKLQTLIKKLIHAKSSPSFFDMMYKQLVDSFLGLRVKAEHYFYSKSGTISFKAKGVVNKHEPPVFKGKSNTLDLLKIRNLINLKLHDEIKRHMGDGRTREILNYRTGRFAHSAEVENISQTREGYLQMTYSYMRYPYDVFLYPSGYLSKPGRDPRGIIGPSIRQLASKYISNNFKVNPVLRGDR